MKKVLTAIGALVGISLAAGPFAKAYQADLPGGGNGSAYPAPETLKWYPDEAVNAIGYTNGGLLTWAARFTIADSTAGQILEAGVYIYIGSYGAMPAPGTLNVYLGTANDAGSPIGTGYVFGPVDVDGWQVYDCSSEGLTANSGDEIWVVASQQHDAGQYPAAVGSGPHVAGYGDWIYYNGSWASLYDLTGGSLDYNWNIYMIVDVQDVNEGATRGLALNVPTFSNGVATITYNLASSSRYDLSIYDAAGKLVWHNAGSRNPGRYAALVSGLKAGNYVVKLTQDGKSITRTLIVR